MDFCTGRLQRLFVESQVSKEEYAGNSFATEVGIKGVVSGEDTEKDRYTAVYGRLLQRLDTGGMHRGFGSGGRDNRRTYGKAFTGIMAGAGEKGKEFYGGSYLFADLIEEKAGKERMKEKYKDIKKLGEGATAQVYLVEEMTTGKVYAMKRGENTKLLQWEAKILERLKGDGFPGLKEYEGKCLVMEYIEGKNLQELLEESRKFSIKEILYLMEEMLRLLHTLHKHKPPMIYRDMKPSNILIGKSGKVYLIDFGAVYSGEIEGDGGEKQGGMAGTYGYAAPEQFWKGVVPDRQCDIYGAGKVLAYLLSGKNPAVPPYDMESYCKRLYGLPTEFQVIIERSLALNPMARYDNCESMIRDLRLAYEAFSKKRLFKLHKKVSHKYIKCIWLSEYRRIF